MIALIVALCLIRGVVNELESRKFFSFFVFM